MTPAPLPVTAREARALERAAAQTTPQPTPLAAALSAACPTLTEAQAGAIAADLGWIAPMWGQLLTAGWGRLELIVVAGRVQQATPAPTVKAPPLDTPAS